VEEQFERGVFAWSGPSVEILHGKTPADQCNRALMRALLAAKKNRGGFPSAAVRNPSTVTYQCSTGCAGGEVSGASGAGTFAGPTGVRSI